MDGWMDGWRTGRLLPSSLSDVSSPTQDLETLLHPKPSGLRPAALIHTSAVVWPCVNLAAKWGWGLHSWHSVAIQGAHSDAAERRAGSRRGRQKFRFTKCDEKYVPEENEIADKDILRALALQNSTVF
eukprot:363446-Chlamydomonas_euryale.AAC.13